jgi:hypothetical protein
MATASQDRRRKGLEENAVFAIMGSAFSDSFMLTITVISK